MRNFYGKSAMISCIIIFIIELSYLTNSYAFPLTERITLAVAILVIIIVVILLAVIGIVKDESRRQAIAAIVIGLLGLYLIAGFIIDVA